MGMELIVAAMISVAGIAFSTAVSSSQQEVAMSKQEQAWRDQLEAEEEEKRNARADRRRDRFQDMINKSGMYKKNVGALWGGR